ncbi:MAG: phosphotransferase family protein [Candidatus Hodarchaeales archaeon]|jgi:aminoglycoside phosphotransferase (APT) family kinase protein
MFYEETNPPGISLSDVMRLLRTCFPNIREQEVKFHYHGSYNVFEVKGEYMFRFPDKVFFGQNGFNLIQREIKLLDLIRKNISLRIPNPTYVSSDPKKPFVGYKKINGVSLSRCFDKTAKNDQKSIAIQLGKFLSELHSREVYHKICTTWKSEQDFNSSQYQCYWQNYFGKVQEYAYPLLNAEQKKWTSHIFLEFLDEKDNFDFVPSVVHRDFDTSNVLVDPSTFEVTGIIDFEETGVYDPAGDFIFYDEGEFFLNHLLANYLGFKDSHFKNRMKFLYCRAGLVYILTGLDYNTPKMVYHGLYLIRKRMKRFPS